MTATLRHVGIVVQNLELAIYFWTDLLGFQIVRKMEEVGLHIDKMIGLEGVVLTTVKLADSNGAVIELLKFHSHPDIELWEGTPFSTGITHIAISIENLDLTISKLQENGFLFAATPQSSLDMSVKVVYAKGPEGLLLELVESVVKE